MRRTASIAVPIAVTVGLLVAGCGSAGTSPSAQATSSRASAPSTSATTGSSTSTGYASATPGSSSWPAAFCTAFYALASGLKSGTKNLDTSTPDASLRSMVVVLTNFGAAFGKAGLELGKIGPPPAGSIAAGIDGFNAMATKLQALAAVAAAVDPKDSAAMSTVQKNYLDLFDSGNNVIDDVDKGLPPEVIASLNTTPECKAPA